MIKHTIAILNHYEKLLIQQYIASVPNPKVPMDRLIELSHSLTISSNTIDEMEKQLADTELLTNNKDLHTRMKNMFFTARNMIE